MIRPSEAQLAEKCGYYVTLRRKNTPTASPYSSFGAAFAALVANKTDEAKEAIARLDAGQESEALLLAARYLANMPRGEGAQHEYQFALRANGERCAWDDPERVTRGKIDSWWKVREAGSGIVLVLRDDKTGAQPVRHPSDNLQFGVYAKALEAEAFGARIIGEIANPRTEILIRHEYQPGEVEALWDRFLKANEKASQERPPAEPGGHCADCWERQRCDVRLLPAMNPAAPELEPFMSGGPPLGRHNVVQALRVVQAMGEVCERAEEQLRAWAQENGPIVDGDKQWGPVPMPGRASADVAALEAAGLKQYIRRGKAFVQFRWKNAR